MTFRILLAAGWGNTPKVRPVCGYYSKIIDHCSHWQASGRRRCLLVRRELRHLASPGELFFRPLSRSHTGTPRISFATLQFAVLQICPPTDSPKNLLANAVGPRFGKKAEWLRQTPQWALSTLVASRLLRPGAECRTTDPYKADLFLVPALTKPKGSSDWMAACAKFDGKALVASLPHLNARTACRHVFLISKVRARPFELVEGFGWS